MKNNFQKLIEQQTTGLLKLLQTFKDLFDGTLSNCKTDPEDFK